MSRASLTLVAGTLFTLACTDTLPTDSSAPSYLRSVAPDPCPTCVLSPVKLVRGRSDRVSATFVAQLAQSCSLTVEDDGDPLTSVVIWLNSQPVLFRNSIAGPPTTAQATVAVRSGTNSLEASVRGGMGHFVTAWITCAPRIAVSPHQVSRFTGESQQFTITGSAGPYTWSVNGIDGGGLVFGTIDPNGLFTAPTSVPTPATFPVCARLDADPAVFDCANVTIATPPALDLWPDAIALPEGRTFTFSVTGPAGPFVYSVNGVDGGTPSDGLVDNLGNFSAPSSVPDPAKVEVCARLAADPSQRDCSTLTVTVEAIVVFNPVGTLFSRWTMEHWSADNGLMFRNLVSFTGSKPRATATDAILDLGHDSFCQGDDQSPCDPFDSLAMIASSAGIQLLVQDTTDLVQIGPNVKVIFLWIPGQLYTDAEINALKRFAAEGGRIVFVGGPEPAYTFWGGGIALENDFLTRLGATLRDLGGSWDTGIAHMASPRHQVTAGTTGVYSGAAAALGLGAYDIPLFYDWWRPDHVLAAVGQIDPTPISN
jgi:hypothetical protein